jgi:hypothetical protein
VIERHIARNSFGLDVIAAFADSSDERERFNGNGAVEELTDCRLALDGIQPSPGVA